jgi:L-ascorbate metabolism protein UlaG (beta-lactamase superfamily)
MAFMGRQHTSWRRPHRRFDKSAIGSHNDGIDARGKEKPMKKTFALTIAILGTAAGLSALSPEDALGRIAWYGQSSLRVELGGLVVWIDPVDVRSKDKADLILVTHGHDDHFSKADISALSGPKTVVLAGFDGSAYQRIAPGDAKAFGALKVEAVPAYNVKKSRYHPKSSGFCGFILSAEGVRIYVAGDTERIPEMKSIACDIVFLPLGQTYTMNSVDEAVQAALDVKAAIAVPYHYGLYEGSAADADAFVAALAAKGVKARRLEKRK